MSQPDLIGTTEAAELLGVSRATVKRLATTGVLPVANRLPGATGALLYRRADVLRLARKRGAA